MNKFNFILFVLFACSWLVIRHFQLPTWTLYLCIIIIGLIQFSFTQLINFKALKHLLPIPKVGYDKAKNDLLEIRVKLDQGLFEFVDEFFIDGTPKILANIYLDISNTSFLSIYHFQSTLCYEFESIFENDYTLTTSSNINSGLFPRPPKKFLVVSAKLNIPDLFKKHEESIEYLAKSGLKLMRLTKVDYRINVEKENEMLSEYLKKPFFALRTIYWFFIKRGKIHCSPLSDQHRKGIISGF